MMKLTNIIVILSKINTLHTHKLKEARSRLLLKYSSQDQRNEAIDSASKASQFVQINKSNYRTRSSINIKLSPT